MNQDINRDSTWFSNPKTLQIVKNLFEKNQAGSVAIVYYSVNCYQSLRPGITVRFKNGNHSNFFLQDDHLPFGIDFLIASIKFDLAYKKLYIDNPHVQFLSCDYPFDRIEIKYRENTIILKSRQEGIYDSSRGCFNQSAFLQWYYTNKDNPSESSEIPHEVVYSPESTPIIYESMPAGSWFSSEKTLRQLKSWFIQQYPEYSNQIEAFYLSGYNETYINEPGIFVWVSRAHQSSYCYRESDYIDKDLDFLKKGVVFDFQCIALKKSNSSISTKYLACNYVHDMLVFDTGGEIELNIKSIKNKIYDTETQTLDRGALKACYKQMKKSLYKSSKKLVYKHFSSMTQILSQFEKFTNVKKNNISKYDRVRMARAFKDPLLCYHNLRRYHYSQDVNNPNKLDQYLPSELVYHILTYQYDPKVLKQGLSLLKIS